MPNDEILKMATRTRTAAAVYVHGGHRESAAARKRLTEHVKDMARALGLEVVSETETNQPGETR